MAAPCPIDQNHKALMASVQLWMSRLQLTTAVVSRGCFADWLGTVLSRSGTDDGFTYVIERLLRRHRWFTLGSRWGLCPDRYICWKYSHLLGVVWCLDSAHLGRCVYLPSFVSDPSPRDCILAAMSYLASFVLVKYNKISVPVSEEANVGSTAQETITITQRGIVKDSQPGHPNIALQSFTQQQISGLGILDSMVTIERVYLKNFFRTQPSARMFHAADSNPGSVTAPELHDAHDMLVRCNSVCVVLTFVGLLLAIIGIMAYVWTTFTLVPGIFVSACFTLSLIASFYALH